MIKTILGLAIIALSVLVHDEQHRKTSASETGIATECPTISVECPRPDDSEIGFILNVKGDDPNVKLRYQWSITRGEIKSGQGTAKIILKAERDGSGIGASVEVFGLPAECANKASCYITHF